MVTTERFAELTAETAASLGADDARVVTVPHPLGGTDEATVLAWADAAIDDLMAAFAR